jgi:para-nitrobenzyl esterase
MHQVMSRLVSALALIAISTTQAEAAGQPIRVDGGLIANAVPDGAGIRSFRGIPYAAAPVGSLRWHAPQPPESWQGVRPVDRFGPACAQSSEFSNPTDAPEGYSEDCLSVNVTTPARSAGERLPVLVWIHGGAYVVGSSASPGLDGENLAVRGLVVVTMNYRLGALGFLAHPELSRESPVGASGNYGILDQIAALRWVHAHIAAFGGDPDRIAIAGHSAGSTSVNVLMASPLARGLFAFAIAEGGSAMPASGANDGSPLPRDIEERKGLYFMNAVGASSLAGLRAVPLEKLLAEAGGGWSRWAWNASIDGLALPRAPLEIFARGEQNDVPLLLGWNSNEGAQMGRSTFGDEREALGPQLATRFGALLPQLLRLYPIGSQDAERAAKVALAGDGFIGYPSWTWAIAQLRTGHQPVFVFKFTHAPPVPEGFNKDSMLGPPGAFHGAELTYLFGTFARRERWNFVAADRHLGEQLQGYWSAFVASGNPNRAGLPYWPRYSERNPHKLYFDDDGAHSAPDGDFERLTRLGQILRQAPQSLRYRDMDVTRWNGRP